MTKKKLTGLIDDYPLVQLTIFDWVSSSEWMSITKAKKLEPSKCFAIGRQFNKTKTKIQLFGSWSYDEDGLIDIGTIETVPRSWVQEITTLKIK
tara:strand:- start:197 stop:478 length:282 start_codon:yes stop_codon:yes gene_type:complete